MNEETETLLKEANEYKEWWLAQFPCPCGHSPDSHYLAPIDGECRSCSECHPDAMYRYSMALAKADKTR